MQNTVAIPAVPFTAAAHEHTEPAFTQAVTLSAAVQQFQFDVPSYGYLRHLWIHVQGTGGSGGNAAADAPWNFLSDITLLDTNGAPIFGPIDGYAAFLANMVGGYAFNQDPADAPWFVSTAPNFDFFIRVPIEISHYDGMGSLANQNAAAPYRLSLSVNTTTNIFATAPSTAAAYTIRGYLEAWSLPNEIDALGRPQAQVPPNHGTVQYWSSRRQDVVLGDNTVQILRTGNLIRNVIFVCRNTSGVRQDNVFPDPILMNWDARQLYNESQRYRTNVANERLVNGNRPTGVFPYSFNHSQMNRSGDDKPTLWIPTVQATRLEVNGSSGAAGTVQVIVNDIAPAEINPAERYVEKSATGFRPNPDVRQ